MPKATDIRIRNAVCAFEAVTFRTPLKFGGRIISKSFLMNVDVEVESRDGKKHASGFGSMPVGNIWAWPTSKVPDDQTESAMKQFAEEVIELANGCSECGHPVDLSYHLSAEYEHLGRLLATKLKLPEPIPKLALAVSASPFDAALHDAYGRLHGLNSYNTLSSKFMSHDLSEYLDKDFKGEYLDKYTLREPKEKLPLYHLVGAIDPLTDAEVTKKIGDGLPDTLAQWGRGLGFILDDYETAKDMVDRAVMINPDLAFA